MTAQVKLNGGLDTIKTPQAGKKKKIAIVGTSPCWHKAPIDDNSWEIWTLGGNAGIIPRYTRWFELHTQRVLKAAKGWDAIFPFLGEAGDKLTLGHYCPELPFAKLYPLDEIKAKFGTYFTSSIALMLALAIHEGADEIGIWGVEMLADEEYARQRPCVEYYLGIAQASGINIVIAEESPILRAERMYAFDYCELSAEIAQMTKEVDYQCKKTTMAKVEAETEEAFWRGQKTMLSNLHKRFG